MARILYSAPIYPPYDKPGSPVYYENLAEEISIDHEVHVIAPYSQSDPFIESKEGLTVYRVVARRDNLPSPVRAVLELFSAFFVGLFVLSTRSIDVCHIHSTSYSCPGFTLAATITRTPLYYDCRDENFPRWLITRGPTVKWFSCASNIDDRLVDCGIQREDIVRLPVVNPPYVGEHIREPGLRDADGLDIVFVGRLLRAKGIFSIVDALVEVQREIESVSLTFVGGGPDRQNLETKVQDAGIDNIVDILGKVPHSDALERLARSDVLVLPSKSEGVPRVIIEALEIGVPVVATPVGGVPDVVTHEETGLLVDDDPRAIAAALIRLSQNEELAHRLAEDGQDRNELWSWKAIRRQVSETYGTAE